MSNTKQLAVELRTFQCLQKSHNFGRFGRYFSWWSGEIQRSTVNGSVNREIVRRGGFLNLSFDDKGSIMADKGFTV